MYGFIHKSDNQVDSARTTIYKLYDSNGRSDSNNTLKVSLHESAKHFFKRKKEVGVVKAFNESTHGTKPGWLLWAVAPAINQTEHTEIVTKTRAGIEVPPWSKL